jgi:hypothetical protein
MIFEGTKLLDNQSVPRRYSKITLFLPNQTDYLLTFNLSREAAQETHLFSEEKTEQLIQRLEAEIDRYDLRKRIFEEKVLMEKRGNMFEETKSIVIKLRETVHTSSTGLALIKAKLQTLQEENKKIELLFQDLKAKIAACSFINELNRFVNDALTRIYLVDTSSWEEEIAPLRKRFLMQKTEELLTEISSEDISQRELLPPTFKAKLDDQTFQATESATTSVVRITAYFPKKKHKQISTKIQKNNSLVLSVGVKVSPKILLLTKEQLTQFLEKIERENFEIGSRIYDLKKEQASLSYEARQTIVSLRSLLMNIGGALGTRNFLKEALANLRQTLASGVSFSEKKQAILKNIARILQVVGHTNH